MHPQGNGGGVRSQVHPQAATAAGPTHGHPARGSGPADRGLQRAYRAALRGLRDRQRNGSRPGTVSEVKLLYFTKSATKQLVEN